MSINLENVSSGYSTGVINDNFQRIEDHINQYLLWRDGAAPGQANQMEAALDMNSNPILNTSTGPEPDSLVNKEYVDSQDSYLQNQIAAIEPVRSGDLSLIGDVPVTTSSGTQTVVDALDRRQIVFNSVADMVAAGGLQVGARVRTLSYYTPNPVSNIPHSGGNDYEVVASGTGAEDGGSFINLLGSGLQARGLFTGEVLITQFGVQPTGDQSTRAQAAIDFCTSKSRPLVIDTTFYAANLQLTCDGVFKTGVSIINNADDVPVATIPSGHDGVNWRGLFSLDGDARDCRGLQVLSDAVFEDFEAKNIVASPAGSSSITGLAVKNNAVARFNSIYTHDMENTGWANESFPQAIVSTLGGKIIADSIFSERCVTVLVLGDSGSSIEANSYVCIDQSDNGVYQLAGSLWIGDAKIINTSTISDEPAVFKGDCTAVINSLTLKGLHNAIGLEDAGSVTINSLNLDNNEDNYGAFSFRLRTGNTRSGTLSIGEITGMAAGETIFLLDTGVLERLILPSMNYTHVHLAGQGPGSTSWFDLEGVEFVEIGDININVIDPDNDIVNTVGFYVTLPVSASKGSTVGRFNIYSTEYPTKLPFRVYNALQENILVSSGVFRADIGPFINGVCENGKKVITSVTAPALGFWKRGEIVYIATPGATGPIGYICTASGSPGTWRSIN